MSAGPPVGSPDGSFVARPVARRALLAIALGGGTAAGLSGCVGLATTGPVQNGGAPGGGNTSPIIVYPRLPGPGADPAQIVLGFLDASALPGPDYGAARAFLTDRAARIWDPAAAVTVFDGTQRQLVVGAKVPVPLPASAAASRTPGPTGAAAGGDRVPARDPAGARGIRATGSGSPLPSPELSARTTVRVEAPNVGALDRRGGWAKAGRVSLPLALDLVTVAGQWRIDNPPPGLVVSANDFARIWAPYRLLYPDPSGSVLVADPVYLADRGTPATSLVQALLGGPASWLAPVVTRTVPPTAALEAGSVTLSGGLATVDLGRVPVLGISARTLLAAQLVQTLAQVAAPPVTAVSVLVDGQPLDIAGVATQEPADSWAKYSADVLSASTGDLALLRPGPKRAGSGLWRGAAASLQETVLPRALSRAARPAWVATDPQGTRLLLVDAAGSRLLALSSVSTSAPPVLLASGVRMLRPQIDREGLVWVQDLPGGTARVRVLGGTPGAHTVPVDTGSTAGAQVSRVWLARDGQRAAVVLRSGETDLVLLEKVQRIGGPALTDPRYVLGPVSRVLDLAWVDAVTIAVLIRAADGGVSVVQVDSDGSDPMPLGAVPGESISITAGPSPRPILVGTATGTVLAQLETQLATLQWQAVTSGFAPAYPG